MNLRDRNIWHILVVSYQKTKINPIWWWVGVCEKNPPVIHILVVSPNKLMGKVANVFTFPKYVYGRIQPTFCSQLTFIGVVPRGKKWSKLAQFHVMKGIKYKRVENNKNSNMTNNCMLHLTGWEPFLGQGLTLLYTPQRLQTPTPERVKSKAWRIFWYAPTGSDPVPILLHRFFWNIGYWGKLHILFSTIWCDLFLETRI